MNPRAALATVDIRVTKKNLPQTINAERRMQKQFAIQRSAFTIRHHGEPFLTNKTVSLLQLRRPTNSFFERRTARRIRYRDAEAQSLILLCASVSL